MIEKSSPRNRNDRHEWPWKNELNDTRSVQSEARKTSTLINRKRGALRGGWNGVIGEAGGELLLGILTSPSPSSLTSSSLPYSSEKILLGFFVKNSPPSIASFVVLSLPGRHRGRSFSYSMGLGISTPPHGRDYSHHRIPSPIMST